MGNCECVLAAGGKSEASCMVREVRDLLIHLMTSRWIPVDIHTPNSLRRHTTCSTSKSGRWWVCMQTTGWTSCSVERHIYFASNINKNVLKRAQKRVCFLCRLRKFNLRQEACWSKSTPLSSELKERHWGSITTCSNVSRLSNSNTARHNESLPTGITVMNSSIINSHLNKQFC